MVTCSHVEYIGLAVINRDSGLKLLILIYNSECRLQTSKHKRQIRACQISCLHKISNFLQST